jgi:tRNA (guanine26-N2/guanine27-N2)-dimethyltransferase
MTGEQTEGTVRFQVGATFYRPESRVVRDLGVLAAIAHRHRVGSLRVLDVMSGCGVRALRYWQEAGAAELWVNDANPDLSELLRANLQEAVGNGICHISHRGAVQLLRHCQYQQDYYDLVDVDAFGAPGELLPVSLGASAVGGLLYLTITDSSTAAGRYPQACLMHYGAYTHWHPASHEQGLRMILGKLQQEAATRQRGVQPVFSLWTGNTFRVMVRLLNQPVLNLENYGFLGYCPQCGDYQVVNWQWLGRCQCKQDGKSLKLSGPLWLGDLHHQGWLEKMRSLAQQYPWLDHSDLLTDMLAEIGLPPYFYLLGDIGRRGKTDIPARSRLIAALQARGFQASVTHIEPQAIKTTASLQTCVAIARQLTGGVKF